MRREVWPRVIELDLCVSPLNGLTRYNLDAICARMSALCHLRLEFQQVSPPVASSVGFAAFSALYSLTILVGCGGDWKSYWPAVSSFPT